MKQFIYKLKNLSITAKLSLFVSILLVFAIVVTISNSLKKQEKRSMADYYQKPSADSERVNMLLTTPIRENGPIGKNKSIKTINMPIESRER